MRRRMTLFAACATLSACGDARPADQPGTDPAADARQAELATAEVTRTYAPELDVDLDRMERRESGLHVEDLVVGDGDVAEPGTTAVVHYTGWLANGEQFDSSRPGGNPYPVLIGAGEVIEGWDEGLPGMRVGGQRRLVIPPALAYGAEGAGMGIIPPGATLIFEVELLEVRR